MAPEVLKILAIDDNADNLLTLRAVVRDALPHTVIVTALDGPRGLALARAEDPDVILLDIVMPGMDGFAVCRALKADERLRTIPVVFLTALRGDQESRLRALEAGAEGFLAKPLDEVELVAQIRAMAKIKAANRVQQLEREQLAALVAERTTELERELAERKRIEETLRESEARYRRLTDNARDIIFRYSLVPEMRLTYINPAVEEITGYSPAECYADPHLMLNLAHPEDRPIMAGFLRPLTPPDKPFTMRWVGKDGGMHWMESRVVPVYAAAGQLVAVEGITRDMTARVQAEAALQESEARHRAIFENMAAACCVDEVIFENGQAVDYRILDVNPAYERITGIPRSQAAGALASVVYGTGEAPFLDIYSRVAATGEPAAFEAHFAPINKDLYITVGSPGPGRFSTVFSDITERKQTEESLRERENMLQKIFDILPIGLWFADKDGRLLRGNPTGVAIWGAEPKVAPAEYEVFRARRLPSGEEIAPDDWALVHTIREGVTVVDELLEIDAFDGRKKTILNYTAPILDEAGEVLGALVVNQDVTERMRAEAELRRVNSFLDTIIENIPDMVFLKDAAELRFVRLNRAGENLLGLSREEILGKNDYDFFPQAEADFFVQKDRQTLQERIVVDIPEETIQTRFQGLRLLHTKKVPIVNANGEPEYLLGISEDITEQVQAERNYRNLFNTMLEGFAAHEIICDTQGRPVNYRFLTVNPAFERATGLKAADIIGRSVLEVMPNTEPYWIETYGRVALTGEPVIFQSYSASLGKHFEVAAFRPAPNQFACVFSDITERVRAEERLQATLAELQRSNADLERFAYIASHDLQEPLRMVVSYAQLLGINYRGRLDADADEFIGYLVEGAMRMHQLLLDLLDYSSINTHSSHPQPADAALGYEMALNNLAPLVAENAAMITCDPLPTILADPAQLTEIFQILIGNAIKFHGAEPPRVHVSARQTFEVSETSKVSARIWEFAVRDNGIGIEPQYFERIFVVFQRLHTRRKYQGNGIGLAICKRIVERHGGRIWVESAPEQGSTFYFTLSATT